jgi:hypothetical protein
VPGTIFRPASFGDTSGCDGANNAADYRANRVPDNTRSPLARASSVLKRLIR